MDKKSKILVVVFIILILFSIYLTFKRAFVDKNFDIINTEEESIE